MNTIPFPNNLNEKFYESTILAFPNIKLDGFYYGPFNKTYEQSRVELVNSYKLIYTCDYWLDGYCWQDNYSRYHVADTNVLRLIEKKYNIFCIPIGCLDIAVKHRDEIHFMSPDGMGFDLIFKKKAFHNYLELNK
jgi:hypothetical protein